MRGGWLSRGTQGGGEPLPGPEAQAGGGGGAGQDCVHLVLTVDRGREVWAEPGRDPGLV